MDEEPGLSVQVEEVSGGGSVLRGEGHEVETGDRVVFHGEYCMMVDIAEAIEAGEEPVAFVPFWAVASRTAA